ncbi:MAG: VOC family protein [Acidobacteriota bacterium]
MFRESNAFSSFSVNDLAAAKDFYGGTLGLDVTDVANMHVLSVSLAAGGTVIIYPKPDHTPATFTVLNFKVPNIDEAVGKLKEKDVQFESYDGSIRTDENNISRGAESGRGPNIAWFRDPAGNILSVIEDDET